MRGRAAAVLLLVVLVVAGCTEPETTDSTEPGRSPTTSTTASTTPPSTSATAGSDAIHAGEGLGDTLFPKAGNEGYDVQHVDLALDFTEVFDSGSFSGVATLRIEPTVALDSFVIDAGDLDIGAITVDADPAPFADGSDQVRIDPEPVLVPGVVSELRIEYSGSVPTERVFKPGSGGIVRDEALVFSIGEPAGSTTWMPGNDHPTDKAPYAVAVTVPTGMEATVGGLFVDSLTEGDSTTFYFEHRLPVATYLVPIAVGDLSRIDRDAEGYAWRDYLGPGVDEIDVLDRQDEMVRYFEQYLGPYPFEANGALVVDRDFWGALETQTLSTYEPGAVQGFVVAHEIAHQWVGNSVSVADWSDIWLNEGFATYLQWMWVADDGGTPVDAAAAEAHARMRAVGPDWGPGEPPASDMFNRMVYDGGALTLHALRAEVGDDAFFEVLERWVSDFAYSSASTADLVELAEDVSGTELGGLFDDWLLGELPDLP